MDNKKNTKIDVARRRKTRGTRCFKKRSLKQNRYTKNNDLTNISSNTTEHQVSLAKKLRKSSMHVENSKQSPYLLGWIVFHEFSPLLVHVHLVKEKICYLLSTQ